MIHKLKIIFLIIKLYSKVDKESEVKASINLSSLSIDIDLYEPNVLRNSKLWGLLSEVKCEYIKL